MVRVSLPLDFQTNLFLQLKKLKLNLEIILYLKSFKVQPQKIYLLR